MQVELPDRETRARIEVIEATDRPLNDDEFFDFCAHNRKLRIEREANGDIIIMPPAGFESEHRNFEICRQLGNWAAADGQGIALGSNTLFLLRTGSARGPDAAWVSKRWLRSFSSQEKRRYLPLCPDFVIELLSPSDRIEKTKAKMREWIENGAALGWLIDPDHRTVIVYRPGQDPEELTAIDEIIAGAPVEGFRLDLREIWQGL